MMCRREMMEELIEMMTKDELAEMYVDLFLSIKSEYVQEDVYEYMKRRTGKIEAGFEFTQGKVPESR